jgi:FixJ family two-component response regulator
MQLSEHGREKDIYILDDDADVREVLSVILEGAGYNAICFANEAALLDEMRQRYPACIVLDVYLPGRSGLEILKDLAGYPAPVLMISGQGDIPTAVDSIKGGAQDFIEKPFRRDAIVGQIEKTIAGFSYGKHQPKRQQPSLHFPGREPLSPRERDVLNLLVSGVSSSKELGLKLGLSPRTVEDHRAKIMRKLGVKNAVELMVAVMQ